MNSDQGQLLAEIKDILRRNSPDDDDLHELRLYTRYGLDFLPYEFVEIVRSESVYYSKTVSKRFSALSAIIRAFELVPNGLKESINAKTVKDEALDPMFNLQTSDVAQVLVLCTDMRSIIWDSKTFDQPHRRRLLDRIAAIEREVNLPKGRMDVVLGGLSDVGEALGKFGKDVKPLVDRMKEIAGIARRASTEYDQLPPPEEIKRLPPPSDNDSLS